MPINKQRMIPKDSEITLLKPLKDPSIVYDPKREVGRGAPIPMPKRREKEVEER